MALTIGDNFSYQGAKPLDTRLQYATIAEMVSKADSTLYDGIIAYCKANGKNYQWKSTNPVDQTLGKWREFQSGGGGTSELANLDDVDLDDPTDGEVLKYDEETGKWVNGESSGGDLTGRAKSTAIAPVFDDTETYAEGDRVMYEDELYVFNTAHTGAWDAADAEKSDVDSEIPDKLTSQQMQEIKDAFVVDSPRNGYPVLFDETGAEHFVGWYKLANGTKKPVYQKIVDVTPTNGTVAHGISNIDWVVWYQLRLIRKSDNEGTYIFPFYMTNDDKLFVLWVGRTYARFYLEGNWGAQKLIIHYTKTTDQPQ